MTETTRRYALYARQSVSRIPEESLSIEFQLQECTAYVQRTGGIIAGSFSDPDTKGWRRNRPGFDAMLDTIRSGKADTVLLFKLSRFARNLMMQEEVVGEIADAGGELVSITEPHITTSPMIRQILGAVNEDYRRVQSDWLRSAFAARARKGQHHGYAPFGYRIEAGALVLGDDADRARQIWDWALEGHGGYELSIRANDRGWTTVKGKPWETTGMLRILRNPLYAGHVRYRGEVVMRDAHPALVSDAEFAEVQAILNRRTRQKRKAELVWTEGFVYHACGRRMYTVKQAGERDPRYRYRCVGQWVFRSPGKTYPPCDQRPSSARASVVETEMVRAVLDLVPRLTTVDQVLATMERQQGSTARDRERQRSRLAKRLDDLTHQRQRLLDLVLSEKVDADLYGTRDDALKAEIATVRAELDATPPTVSLDTLERHHGQIRGMLQAVTAVVNDDPSRVASILSAIDAKWIIGDGPGHLEIGEAWRPYFD